MMNYITPHSKPTVLMEVTHVVLSTGI